MTLCNEFYRYLNLKRLLVAMDLTMLWFETRIVDLQYPVHLGTPRTGYCSFCTWGTINFGEKFAISNELRNGYKPNYG